jgi:hypothetical protein
LPAIPGIGGRLAEKPKMKTAILLFVIFYFLAAHCWDDYEYTSNPCGNQDSWALYENAYKDTEVIVDPYK